MPPAGGDGADRHGARDLSGAYAARRRRRVRRRHGAKPLLDPVYWLSELGMVAANVLARAIARGVYEATALPLPNVLRSWKDWHG